MKILLASMLALGLAEGNARAHSASYFGLATEFGALLSAAGDQACITAIADMVEDIKKHTPVTHTYLVYNGSIACDQERGTLNSYDQSFQIGLRDQAQQGYRYDRIFSGVFLNNPGRADITANMGSGLEACRLAYKVTFTYSRGEF